MRVANYVSLAFYTAVPFSGRHLVRSFNVGQSPLLATFEIDILFSGGVATFEPFNPSQICNGTI